MKRIKLKYPVFVEGEYDKKRLCAVAEATVIVGNGFGVFNSTEKTALLRRITREGKLIVLTDSDGAGSLIRNKLKGRLNGDNIINLYTPALTGKEKRKKAPSKAGLLGVEGMSDEVLYKLLLPFEDSGENKEFAPVSTADLYQVGLTGKKGSERYRAEFCLKAGLPPTLTPKAFREAINILGGMPFLEKILLEIK